MASISQPHVEPVRAELLQRLAATQRAQAATMEALASALEALATEAAPPPSSDEDRMFTVAEAAVALRRSAAHVRAACRRGAIKALRDGHGYRIRQSALRAYERRRTAS